MNAQALFRASKSQKINDAGAGKKPLSSGDKEADKQTTLALAIKISELQNILYAEHQRKILVVLQGMDTSGKDGTVRGVFGSIDPLGIRSIAFKAPTASELDHDYLWRAHQQVPGKGEMVIFNRSHYEDVLITRVHGWIDDKECKRRFAQIRDFERMLAETGTVIMKFHLHISAAEQKLRLQERLTDPLKHWKFDVKDLQERTFWPAYQTAYARMIIETDDNQAPWYVVPADSKTHRNLTIASIVHETMLAMKLAVPPPHPEYAQIKVE